MPIIKPEPTPEEQPGWFAADSVIIPFLGSPIESTETGVVSPEGEGGFYFERCGNMEVTDNTLPQAIAVAGVPGADVDMVHNMGRSSGTITISGLYTDKEKFEQLRAFAVTGTELKFRSEVTGSWIVQIKTPQFGYASQRQGRFTFSIQMQCVRGLGEKNSEEAALQKLKLAGLLAEAKLKGKCPSEAEVEYKTFTVTEGDNLYDIARQELQEYTSEGDPGDRWYEIAEINSPVDPIDPTIVTGKPPLLDPFNIVAGQELRIRLIPIECVGYQEDRLVAAIEESTGLVVSDEVEQAFLFIQPQPERTIHLKEFYGIVRLPEGLSDVELIVGGIDAKFARGSDCRSVLKGLELDVTEPLAFFEEIEDSPIGTDIKTIAESDASLGDKVAEIRKMLKGYFDKNANFVPEFEIEKRSRVLTGRGYKVTTQLDKEGLTKLAYYILRKFDALPKTNSYKMYEVTDEFAKENAVMISDVLWESYAGYPKYITQVPIVLDEKIPGIYQLSVLVRGEVQETIQVNFKPRDKSVPDIYLDRATGRKIPVIGYDTGSNAVKLQWGRPVRNVGDEDESTLKYKIQYTDVGKTVVGDFLKMQEDLKKRNKARKGKIKGKFVHPDGFTHEGAVVKVFKVSEQVIR